MQEAPTHPYEKHIKGGEKDLVKVAWKWGIKTLEESRAGFLSQVMANLHLVLSSGK